MRQVRFVENHEDQLHCLQACLISVFDYFEIDGGISFNEMDRITGFEVGKLTWPMKAYYEAVGRGLDVIVYDPMDFPRFVADTKEYMTEEFGANTAEKFYRESNVEEAVEITRKLLKMRRSIALHSRVPTYAELQQLLTDGYLCICHVNQDVIRNKDGYGAHSVLVMDATEDCITAHNPGPPAVAYQSLTRELFEKAWASPNEGVKTIFALKA